MVNQILVMFYSFIESLTTVDPIMIIEGMLGLIIYISWCLLSIFFEALQTFIDQIPVYLFWNRGVSMGTVVCVYDSKGSPCEQTFCYFPKLHREKKLLSITKLCSILQELIQYQAPGIEWSLIWKKLVLQQRKPIYLLCWSNFVSKIHLLPMVRTEHSQCTKGLQSRLQCLSPCLIVLHNSK